MEYVLNEYHRDITNEELLDDIQRVAKIVNTGYLTRDDYRELGKYSSNTITRRFGSWLNALRLCNIEINDYQIYTSQIKHRNREVTDKDLLEDVCHVAEILGKRTISSGEYQKYSKYSAQTCYKRFSSWENTLNNAGLDPFVQVPAHKIPDDDLLAEIGRMWEALGRQPTSTDIKNGVSRYSLNAFTRRFGGWRRALEAFILWIGNDKSPTSSTDTVNSNLPDTSENISGECANQINNLRNEHRTRREIPNRLRYKVLLRDNFKCRFCGASPATDPSVVLHIDHITPWAKGGETVLENLQTLCSKCNLGKGDLLTE